MRNQYEPDKWVVLKINDAYFVFGIWPKNYWRRNSGITEIEDDGDYLLFHGRSGSTYRCHKERYGTSLFGEHILADVQRKAESDDVFFEILSETDALNLSLENQHPRQ